ncbi:MAG TPA: glycine-rich protein [Candidatus Cybelea sp.]
MRTLGRNALTIGAAAALLAACGGLQPPIAGQGPMQSRAIGPATYPRNRTFNYSGKEEDFRVPVNVTHIAVVVRGAAGGGGVGLGGRGGRVFAIIPVRPNETLAIFVGGQPSRATGGFNGGASAGMNRHEVHDGFGGGGASDIREGGDRLIDRIVVAGGGGGKGGYGYGAPYGVGGKGGGSTGGTGVSGGASSGLGGDGGTGGTQDTGGLGGRPGASSSARPGANGSFGSGGHGGSGCQQYRSCENFGGSGGGGGGGYYGGGGGGGGTGNFFNAYPWGGGGGGGGSSYIEPSATRFESWQGWKNATTNGLVVISW